MHTAGFEPSPVGKGIHHLLPGYPHEENVFNHNILHVIFPNNYS